MIGGGIALLSAILTQSCEYLVVVPGYGGLGFECLPFAIPWIPLWPVLWSFEISNAVSLVLGTIIWFLLGSLVGALIGYIKKKRTA